MANSTPTKVDTAGTAGIEAWEWALGDADTGLPVGFPVFADATVAVFGTFDSATVTWQGTVDGTNWFSLKDPQGNAMTYTSTKAKGLLKGTKEEVASIIKKANDAAAKSAEKVSAAKEELSAIKEEVARERVTLDKIRDSIAKITAGVQVGS